MNRTPRVLVTAGGTSERIDDVRSITNTATGLLGSLTADRFSAAGAEVTFVCTKNSRRPAVASVKELHTVVSAADLAELMEHILKDAGYDCIVHSMAVSDYTVKNVVPSGKIDSDQDELALLLKRTPKVISLIRRLQPQAFLVGFKLLSGSTEDELIRAARKLMEANRCELVAANDLTGIGEGRHEAILLGKDGDQFRVFSKEEIAAGIVSAFSAWRDKEAFL